MGAYLPHNAVWPWSTQIAETGIWPNYFADSDNDVCGLLDGGHRPVLDGHLAWAHEHDRPHCAAVTHGRLTWIVWRGAIQTRPRVQPPA